MGYAQRNFLVPILRVESFAALNAQLEGRCLAHMDAVLRGHTESIGQRLERDLEVLLPLPVAAALDDDLVAGVGQAIKGAVAQYGILEETQPLVHGPVAGDHEAGGPVPVEDQLVQVSGLLGGETVQPQVIQDQQVRGQEGAEAALQRVVHPGLGHDLEEIVGLNEAHGVAGADGGVA